MYRVGTHIDAGGVSTKHRELASPKGHDSGTYLNLSVIAYGAYLQVHSTTTVHSM